MRSSGSTTPSSSIPTTGRSCSSRGGWRSGSRWILSGPRITGLYPKSARTLRKLREIGKRLTDDERILLETALYNEACTLAINGQTEQALDSLAEASAAGFSQVGLIDEDEELVSIRTRPKFQKVRAQVAERARAQVRCLSGCSSRIASPSRSTSSCPTSTTSRSLADFKGKVTIVDLWGTWCKPCRKEVPNLVALYKTYHDKGLEIVGLTYELPSTGDVKATIKAFAKENRIPYPCLIGNVKIQEQIPNFEGFPTSTSTGPARFVPGWSALFRSGQEILMDEIVKSLLSENSGTTTANP